MLRNELNLLGEWNLWLFGSRVDLTKKGGDIDLFIDLSSKDVPQLQLSRKLRIGIQSYLGERKTDLVLRTLDSQPSSVYDLILNEGVLLWTSHLDSN